MIFQENGAIFSPDRLYRYSLWRLWEPSKGHVVFIGLNPSTADENLNDPTIRRCITFAKDWGYGGLYMLNLFGFRSTDPKALKRMLDAGQDPVGLGNDINITSSCGSADLVVAAWGNLGALQQRGWAVLKDLQRQGIKAFTLGLTKEGTPRHPLYIAKGQKPLTYIGA